MFVRTKDGKIFDCYVSEQMGKPIYYPKRSKTNGYIDWNEVYKKSENIIDILEVGDYVNGYEVSFKGNDYQPFVQCDYPVQEGTTNHYRFYEKAIYSIVTKEQFESMSYRIGDDK